MHAIDLPTACENCATPLQGRYCHACGQSVANPLRHAGHALEEVFESFWHLDGRVFCTLRELVRPGRVALGYLAGRRARYIAPLRLFLVLSVLTFFVGKLVVGATDSAPAQVQTGSGEAATSISRARTVAEVDTRLQAALEGITEARRATDALPGMKLAMDKAEREARASAEKRIAELGGRRAASMPSASPTTADKVTARSAGAVTAAKPPSHPTPGPTGDVDLDLDQAGPIQMLSPSSLRDPKRPWNEHDNPVVISWLPDFGNAWVNHKLANAERNTKTLKEDGSSFWPAVMSQVPTALFVLVPVFALLLKLFYIGSRRGYLEHLVVALYSHAFLLLGLLGLFVLTGLKAVVGYGLPQALMTLVQIGLWGWLPIYLLLMQKRVYAQGWPATAVKYSVIGVTYLFLVMLVLIFAVFAVFFGG